MTGQFCGVASRFGYVALPGFYRIWCALHQLELVLQRLYTSLCDDSFVRTLTSLSYRPSSQTVRSHCIDGIKVC
jgi:hypothetical protein